MKEKDWSNIRVGHVVVKELDEQYVVECEERIKNGELKRYNKKWICKCDCGKTPQEFLDDLQWKDALKKDFAIQQGYKYLALSYKDFKDDTFKNKIEEVVL